ncbi:MAG: class 1 fructose-bisphosphatase [Gammaproteobacteria bacterium]|nr:class 1 fructose-bisphosphatase [Rhodocyclaceae bacterium]MBU3910368.1 class 1 fructose-bisphosphatase [Gammaproteobacteria bacterium]MBU3989498.1 class 1 fructose-bisphosphatase [Gammaproteobacteria bacterium]MBU4004849.1 class 1 fructose-bisphosphatase [Gammaproteobacteria bacterium]MBU4020442.1 class 1 fructose-bisphosphatase [Gammaproteobacteria bacterium]
MEVGRITLTQFINEEQRQIAGATGDFTGLLNDIAIASKTIANAVGKGALLATGKDLNAKLEAMANEVMLQAGIATGHLAAMASEDMKGISHIPAGQQRGKYLLTFDPLNGSGNLDINFQTGTIFSVLRAPDLKRKPKEEDFLQPGAQLLCAGLIQYGASIRLLLTTGLGVNGFTLDREVGEYILTHPKITIPTEASTFAINASNERFWEPPVRRYVQECMAGKEGPRGKDFGMRWVASLVAEAYRILTRGGVFLYPHDERTREQGGRLGLLYEANPIAFIIEQAGGAAITGRNRILDIKPGELHQRAPFIFGSKSEVERLHRYHQEYIEGKDLEGYNMPLFSSRSLFR